MSPNHMNSESSSLLNRRDMLSASGLLAGGALLAASSIARADHHKKPAPWRYGLNMSTIRGQNLDAAEEIEIAGKAGYNCIEPWFRKIGEYTKKGGKLKDLKKRIDDHGLTVESAIGFASWIVDDEARRAKGFEEAKRDMDTIAQLGGIRIAARPPARSEITPSTPCGPLNATPNSSIWASQWASFRRLKCGAVTPALARSARQSPSRSRADIPRRASWRCLSHLQGRQQF